MTDYHFRAHHPMLSEEVAAEASSYIDSLINSGDHNWSTNFGWLRNGKENDINIPRMERYDNLCLVHKVVESNRPLYEKIVRDIKRLYPAWEPEDPTAVQFFVWTGGSCIEWHVDVKKEDKNKNGRTGAVTIYLNRRWDIEWGGDFLFKDEKGRTQRVTPQYNLGVAIRQVSHRSTKIQGRHFRKCIQIFMKDLPVAVDDDANFC